MISSTLFVRMLLAGLFLAASLPGCHNLRFQDKKPKPPAPIPTEISQPDSHWTRLARVGRNAHRAGELEASKQAYMKSFEATGHYPPDDIRVTTSLDNLARVATALQMNDEYEQAAPLTEILADNMEQGRLAEFSSGAPSLIEQAERFSQEEQFDSTIRYYRAALGLLGVDKSKNRTLKIIAQRNLVSAYIDADQIAEAKQAIGPLREEVDEKFGEDSPVALGLWISLGKIRVANGDFEGAESAYKTVIDSESALERQKIQALELYGELLRNTDRENEAKTITQQLDSIRQQDDSKQPAGADDAAQAS